MSDAPIDFASAKKEREEQPLRHWMCAECGCTSFELYEDGRTECCLCHLIGEAGHWHEKVVVSAQPEPSDARSVVYHGNAEFAKASLAKGVSDPAVCGVILLFRNGKIRAWSNLSDDAEIGEPQQKWLRKMLLAAESLILGSKPVETDPLPSHEA